MYVVTLLFFFGQQEIILIILLLEFLSWIFSVLLSSSLSLKYFLIQSLFLLGRLVSVLSFNKHILILFFLLKLGLPPFHLWFFNLSLNIKKWVFLFFSSLHKRAPLMIIRRIVLPNFFLLFFIVIVTIVFILEAGDLFIILLLSSVSHSRWMIFRNLIRRKLFFLYFVLYTIVLYFLILCFFYYFIFRGLEQDSAIRFLWLVISGLPPFRIFWLKVCVVSFFLEISFLGRLALLIVSIVRLFTYYRIFHLSLSSNYFRRKRKGFSFQFVFLLGIIGIL